MLGDDSEPIAIDRKTVTCPFIDVIDYETLAYRAQDEGARGAFDWELYYKRLPLLPEDLKHPSAPFKEPRDGWRTFAIDRRFF
ncbi:n-acetylgalactosaminyltransferase 6 [Caerostris extrusa]|uniref:N-acetylgalactosaminyltransferase 6 n=1 Tax=Caerostris extrusa TaxID=172846 RepID=A0AAV4P2Z8_CAEEX|nr:n-acetylgalactosaminyltransferase 6 [Caerostris extrusa]